MNIAICDDEIKVLGELERIVYDSFHGDANQFICDTFLSGEELLKNLKKEPQKYQIYILDIEMDGINGLALAALIREEDFNAIIIFVTGYTDLMQEAFEVNAFHYLMKPINEQKVKQIILKAVRLLTMKKTVFQFRNGKKRYNLYYEEIELFESNKRKIIIYSKDNTYEYYDKMKELIKKLDTLLFVQIHNSFIINMEYIKYMDGDCIVLKSGKRLTITKKFHNDFNCIYRNYILMRVR